jgi:peroxiredoxin
MLDDPVQPTTHKGRIRREGLPKGSIAPCFLLPDVRTGERFSSSTLRGSHALLVFSDSSCEPCTELLPLLQALHLRTPDINVLMISRGNRDDNAIKAVRFGLTFPVLAQKRWEISVQFGIFVTPAAFLLDAEGSTASEVAIGAQAILALLKAAAIRCLLEG